MTTRPKRPRDLNQLAKRIVDISVGEVTEPPESRKASAGRLGGLRGGVTRMASLSPEERSKLAKRAAKERWKKPAPKKDAG